MKLIVTNQPPVQCFGDFCVTHHDKETFVVVRRSDGYGYWHDIRLPGGIWPFTTVIARIYDREVRLNHPQYLSDIQRLAELYEHLGGKEITIHCQEAQ